MDFREVIEVLGFATSHERLVTITTTDHRQVVGVPTSVDPDPAALEIYLRPSGSHDLEIAIPLAAIRKVELDQREDP